MKTNKQLIKDAAKKAALNAVRMSDMNLSLYERRIIAVTACSTEDVQEVESYMRMMHRTLDHLSVKQFNESARDAFALHKQMQTLEIYAEARQLHVVELSADQIKEALHMNS